MKHLPNFLTICNLICGCAAIVYIMNAQPYLAGVNGEEYWVTGVEQMQLGAIFIGLAAIFDLLDGFAARALKIFSPIGADLDSLADVVSFGVAPSMILYKMLWGAYMLEPYAMDVSMWAMLPAFAVAAFAAIRLAKYNVYSTSKSEFTGMPVPAVGLFVASLPFLNFYGSTTLGVFFQSKWVIYAVIGLLSYLMVSEIKFLKLLPENISIKTAYPQILLILLSLILLVIFKSSAGPLILLVYILISFVPKQNTIRA